jgi:hypothetical protein
VLLPFNISINNKAKVVNRRGWRNLDAINVNTMVRPGRAFPREKNKHRFKGVQRQLSGVEPHPNSITDNLEMASGHGRIFVTSDNGDVIGVSNKMDGEVKRKPE